MGSTPQIGRWTVRNGDEEDVRCTAAPPPARPQQAYFFSTCLIDVIAPQAGMDAIALLRAAGIEVDFPAAQSCCGQPAYTSGYTDQA